MDLRDVIARGGVQALIQKAETGHLTVAEARRFLRSIESEEAEEIAPGRRRQRCRACRRCFGFVVIQGCFCSPECAGIIGYYRALRLVTENDGRYCPRCRSHLGHSKRIYTSREQALAEADARGLTAQTGKPYAVYICSEGHRHVGSKKSDGTS
jgi:hypothetical protein